MKRLIQTIIGWPFGCLILFLASCENPPTYNTHITTAADSAEKKKFLDNYRERIIALKDEIRDGDLLTRTGNDFTSESLRSLNQKDQSFSHCGIASIENDTIFVYHALGGEFNPDQKLRRDPVELFADPTGNKAFGIFRFNTESPSNKVLATEARKLFEQGVMFDMDFNLDTDDRMYCAEFVYKTIERASQGKLRFGRSQINKFIFVGVDDLFLHPQCMQVNRLSYK